MTDAGANLIGLSDEDRQVVEPWLVEFDQSWSEGRLAARVRDLPPPGSRLRLPTLVEMVKIDMERRWQLEHRINLEDYIRLYPEIGTAASVSCDLILAEFEVRRQFGDSADFTQFAQRFPRQAAELRKLVAEKDSRAAGTPLTPNPSPPKRGEGSVEIRGEASRIRGGSSKIRIEAAKQQSLSTPRERAEASNQQPLSPLGERGRGEGAEGQQSHKSTVPPRPAASTPSFARPTGAPRDLPEQFGRYRIIRKLGAGGMGTVYLAHDTQLDREVALKVPRFSPDDGPEILERFYREARAAATFDHPNLCPVHDVGEINGIHFLTMAYIEGHPMSEFVRAPSPATPLPASGERGRGEGWLPQRQVATAIKKLALALEEAHRRGVIHRDLKPSNIIINQRREPVIMDFGLARRVTKQRQDARLTQSGMMIGTPAYMPPEQVNGDLAAMGPRCDIYSLGVIMYELLTGRLPFDGPPMAIMAQILTQEPHPPSSHRPDVDMQLAAICLKAMAKNFDSRYHSMAELADALGNWLQADPTPAPAPLSATGDRRASGKRIATVATALLVAVMGFAGLVVYRIQTDHGTLVVEIIDDSLEAKLKQRGVEFHDPSSGRTFTVRSKGSQEAHTGTYRLGEPGTSPRENPHGLKLLVLDDAGLEVATNEFKLTRGGKVRVRVTPEQPSVSLPGTSSTAQASTLTEQASESKPPPQSLATRELLRNAGCEELMQDGKIPGWTAVLGQWRRGGQDGVTPPYEGEVFFHIVKNPRGELIQDVDVSEFAAAIDAAKQQFKFVGHVRSYKQDNPDISRIIVEYRDATNVKVLNQYDSGPSSTVNFWRPLSDVRLAPPGTRWIRVRLICIRTHAENNDAYHDGLSLRALEN